MKAGTALDAIKEEEGRPTGLLPMSFAPAALLAVLLVLVLGRFVLPEWAVAAPKGWTIPFIGVSHRAGAIATVLFAIPPMARLTFLGLRVAFMGLAVDRLVTAWVTRRKQQLGLA